MLNIRPEYQFTFSDWQRSLLILRDYPEDEDLPTEQQEFVDVLEVAKELRWANGQWPTYEQTLLAMKEKEEAEHNASNPK